MTYGLDANPDTVYTANDLNRYGHVASSDELHEPSEYLCYDPDGNLTRSGKPTSNCEAKDGAWKYVWDSENRLISMYTGSDLGNPQSNDNWLEFAYDYMGRRVEKTYKVYASGWQVQEGYPIRFVYDGWNPVLVLKSDNSTKRKLTWGLDLSGTIQGAGGIGGLLAVVETQGTEVETDDDRYWFFYDANGNVGQIMDADNLSGDPAARYEYDPYGSVISSSGPYKDANPFRFSTKWFDDETGLGYWGYRYYSPRLGRWASTDPVAEPGWSVLSRSRESEAPRNLFLAMKNAPTDYFDAKGLKSCGRWTFDSDMGPTNNSERRMAGGGVECKYEKRRRWHRKCKSLCVFTVVQTCIQQFSKSPITRYYEDKQTCPPPPADGYGQPPLVSDCPS